LLLSPGQDADWARNRLKIRGRRRQIVLARYQPGEAENTAKEIRTGAVKLTQLKRIFLKRPPLKKMAEAAMEKFGKIDILVNNAAIWYGLNAAPGMSGKKRTGTGFLP